MNEPRFVIVCGRCQVTLTPENTGDLGYLQPNCDDCTIKHESECKHKWFEGALLSNPPKQQCILCGYTRKL